MSSVATSNWNHLFDDFQFSAKDFYKNVEAEITRRQLPDVKMKTLTLSEGGLMSKNRLYFEVKRKDYIFHICAAPFGTGFFVSWWLREKISFWQELLIKIPYIGEKIVERMQYKPYYVIDTATMFRSSVHQSILNVIDTITQPKGIKSLSEFERKPNTTPMNA
ncbi:MAG: hypothetical protein POELPBGB_01396 [Bacteroidia bacterium]|nr:hypothetical protein [Bacteroidia bacterium]